MRKKIKNNNPTKTIKPLSTLEGKTYDTHSSEPLHKVAQLIPFMSATSLKDSEELEKIIGNMKLEAKLHKVYMQEEEARHNTKVKPLYDNLDSFLEEQIMKDNQLEKVLQATIAGEEINFDLQKALLK